MGGGQYLLKISEPLHLIKTYQMKPRLALSISLDSTFNDKLLYCNYYWHLQRMQTVLEHYYYD